MEPQAVGGDLAQQVRALKAWMMQMRGEPDVDQQPQRRQGLLEQQESRGLPPPGAQEEDPASDATPVPDAA